MKTSHRGLGITADEWDAYLVLTGKVLDEHAIGAQEKQEFLELFKRYRADIVELPANSA
jgi:hemoglobin